MSLKPAWEWTEDDLLALERSKTPENLELEYKRADALDTKDDDKKTEIGKDVSAMANSAGGTVIYGVDENKATRTMSVVNGVDPTRFNREWLEQVINSRVQRHIDGLRVHEVGLDTRQPGKTVLIVVSLKVIVHPIWPTTIASTSELKRLPLSWRNMKSGM